MKPERWEAVERLYNAVLELEPGRREAFLDESCAGDESLRKEVMSLLACQPEAEGLLESPALEAAAKELARDATAAPPIDMTGRTIAHYRVLEKIGEGGMGVVYKARDLHLGRFVALKVLPPEHIADPDRKRRFVQEARAASALNHPNIVTVHDITREGGTDFIVMEYVEGKTLDRRIGHRGLRLPDVLNYAVQIADALARAHSAGIIHRDLKPTNIMVTEDGLVKILDFGLAKLTEQIPGDESASTGIADAEGKSLTGEGLIIGTVSYMSPEQAEGKKVDARSDIFSFGAVLYEMVTGQKAFQGSSNMSTLSAILHQEPKPASQISQRIPHDLEKLISRCLRKDPARRLQHMDDAKVALDELKDELESGRAIALEGAAKIASLPPATNKAVKRRWIWAVAALLVVCLLGIGVVWLVKRAVGPPPELTQRRLTANSIENPVFSGIISPDGRSVAYSDAAGIHLKLIETGDERILARPSGISPDAAWSVVAWFPDGSRLLVNLTQPGGRRSIWVISVIAENALRLRDDSIGWSVSPDGAHIAYTTGSGQNYYREIWIMNPQGEGAEKILSVDENNRVWNVQWSPDSQRLAYIRNRLSAMRFETSIETCTLKGTDPSVIVADWLLNRFCWTPQGSIIYARLDDFVADSSNFWKVPLSSRTGESENRPTRLTNWAGFYVDGLGVSADGKRMIYKRSANQIQVYVGELEAGGTGLKSPGALMLDERGYSIVDWTGDSKRIIFLSNRNRRDTIYKQAVDGGAPRVLVSPLPSSSVEGICVSPDGAWLLYMVAPEEAGYPTPFRLMRVSIDGGPSQFVLEGKNSPNPCLLCARAPSTFCAVSEQSPDGKLLTITSFDPLKGRGRILKTFETDPTAKYDWRLSPDGSKLAFMRREEPEAHIRLFSLTGGKDQEITVKGWGRLQNLEISADGEAFYSGTASPEGATILRIDMEGRAQVLWRQKGSSLTWAVASPDGRRIAIPAMFQNSNLWMVEGF